VVVLLGVVGFYVVGYVGDYDVCGSLVYFGVWCWDVFLDCEYVFVLGCLIVDDVSMMMLMIVVWVMSLV